MRSIARILLEGNNSPRVQKMRKNLDNHVTGPLKDILDLRLKKEVVKYVKDAPEKDLNLFISGQIDKALKDFVEKMGL